MTRGDGESGSGGRRNDGRTGNRGPVRSATRPAERTKRAEPTRFAAYTLQRAVADGAYANLELPHILRRARLTGRDAAFATELAFGTLRHRSLYDAVIGQAADRAVTAIDDKVLDVLRVGTHQLLGMRVPVHAAVDQTVGLARSVAGHGAGGFANAVLRRVSERTSDQWLEAVVGGRGGVPSLALEHSHPEWIVSALQQALIGHGAATPATVNERLADLLRTDNDPPKVALVARPGLSSVVDLVDRGAAPSTTSPIGAVLDSGVPGEIDLVRDGRAAVQDVGSQLLALALAAAPIPDGLPDRWLDLCAGPGGKASVLAGLATDAGVDLVANEVSPHRADLVRQTLAPAIARAETAGRSVTVRTGDGTEIGADEPAAYAKVLVDAPCTGLGALRRRPEARWRRQPSDLAQLGPLQRDLLRSALDAVAPGGVVAYTTCSPHLAETTFVVRDVLKGRADIEVLDAHAALAEVGGGALDIAGEGPHAQLWPHLNGTDGMFMALLRRR